MRAIRWSIASAWASRYGAKCELITDKERSNMIERFSRRKLLKQAAAATAATMGMRVFGTPAILADRSPNQKLATVVIGFANQGISSVNAAAGESAWWRWSTWTRATSARTDAVASGERVPDDQGRPASKTYYDYRQMFDEMHKDIDAVFIAAPDHHHAVAAMAAISWASPCTREAAGPLASTRCAADRGGAEVQGRHADGQPGHSGEGVRRLCEYIWAGAIGNVMETYSWAPTGRGGVGGRCPPSPYPRGCTGTSGSARPPTATTTTSCTPALAELVGVRRRLGGRLGLP